MFQMLLVRLGVFPLISLLMFSGLRLEASEGAVDSREQCRIHVSGTYLSFLNDLDVLKNNLTSTSETVYGMKARQKLATQKLKALLAQSEAAKTPAAELDETILGIRYELDANEEEMRDAEVRVVSLKEQIAAKEKAFAAFKEGMKTVFEAVNAKIVSQGAYPLKLQYRHPCSKYQQLCALPVEQGPDLIRLSKQLEDPVPCEHYAKMRI